MAFKKLLLASSMLVFSANVNAALITQGALVWDDTTNIITNTQSNVEYLSFNVLADLNYAETLAVLGTQDGGGWSIAASVDSGNFAAALLNPAAPVCDYDGTNVGATSICGSLTGWYDGKLGDNFNGLLDTILFLDDLNEADYVSIGSLGDVELFDSTIALSDINFSTTGGSPNTASWLVTRPTAVPVPAAVYLFGSGLLGLIGVARRKARA